MKKIITNGEFILGPYTSIVDQDNAYLADNELIAKNLIEGWTQQEVADDYQHPVAIARKISEFNAVQRAKRAKTYILEADALFFMAQRGDIPEQEWLDKVSEIKARFPYIT